MSTARGIDVGADEVAAPEQRGNPGRSAAAERIADQKSRLGTGLDHELEELHRLLRRIRGTVDARHGPHIGQVATLDSFRRPLLANTICS